MHRSLIGCLFALFLSSSAHAVIFDFNGFYFSDTLTSSSETANTRMFLEGALSLDLDKKGRYILGWSYSIVSYSVTDSNGTTTASATDMGPRAAWFMNKTKTWSIGATYNLIANNSFNDGATVEWRGSSMKFDIGYTAPISENMLLGVRMNYYLASYSEEFDASNNFTQVTRGLTSMFPSFSFAYRFN